MGRPDEKGVGGAVLVQCHASLGMAFAAPVSLELCRSQNSNPNLRFLGILVKEIEQVSCMTYLSYVQIFVLALFCSISASWMKG